MNHHTKYNSESNSQHILEGDVFGNPVNHHTKYNSESNSQQSGACVV